MISVGEKVSYNESTYIILHIYESGYVEIKDVNYHFNVQLVDRSQIELLNCSR